ncbi:MAG: 6-bladed beta-propeller, partial [Verrucomicrobiota bacterium]
PCDVAVTPENEILVVDGYATNRVLRYKPDGSLVGIWGGTKPGDPATLVNAHGISIDASDPENPLVWVSSREENKLKAFTVEGEFKGEVELPGAYAGQAFFAGGRIYTGVCWSKENGTGKRLENSGFLLVLDRKSRKVISAPGGTEPKYIDGVLQPLHQQVPVFKHVHDLYVDSEGDIYVGEWNSGNRYPYKLELIRDES